jgi:phenylacetate-CoA ligase
VFETGIRQFRMVFSMVMGKPINPQNIERLIQDALKTLEEFGVPGDDAQQMLEGPFADPNSRRSLQTGALQRTARRLARVSPYYQRLFAAQGIAPKDITVDTIHTIPVTRKAALQEQQQDFLATDTHPFLTTRTTGTTGRPAEVWLSKYEVELWPALNALSGLLRNEISPSDCLQINLSSRATGAVQLNMSVARLVGARAHALGIIPPDESLDHLLAGGDEAPTILNTYPSYLAHLVRAARRRRRGPTDFHLRRVECGGEVLSPALAQAARDTLGAPVVNDIFAMTEVLPVTGRICSQGHLHPDANIGFVEVIDLKTGKPAEPGALGTLVVTPYYPYRECMPVFRYDTRDVVRQLPNEALTCELAGMPATSRILSKADQLLEVNGQTVTTRELVETLEALPAQPWPARFQARVSNDEIELRLTEQALADTPKEEIERRFRAAGIELRVAEPPVPEQEGPQLRPLRADLLETTFAAREAALVAGRS